LSPDKLKPKLPLPTFVPANPAIRREAFDREDYIFELKMDGFRALAYIDEHETRLVSRKGNVNKSFVQLACAIHIDLDCQAVLDGEIVILRTNRVLRARRDREGKAMRLNGAPLAKRIESQTVRSADIPRVLAVENSGFFGPKPA